MFEIFEHTADLGIRVRADNLEELFTDAALGLFHVLAVNLDSVKPVHERSYSIAGDQYDLLLFDWLSELLYTFETEHLLLVEYQVSVETSCLTAICHGELADEQRHQLDHEVKAITYHGLTVEPNAGGWLAEVIVDI